MGKLFFVNSRNADVEPTLIIPDGDRIIRAIRETQRDVTDWRLSKKPASTAGRVEARETIKRLCKILNPQPIQ